MKPSEYFRGQKSAASFSKHKEGETSSHRRRGKNDHSGARLAFVRSFVRSFVRWPQGEKSSGTRQAARRRRRRRRLQVVKKKKTFVVCSGSKNLPLLSPLGHVKGKLSLSRANAELERQNFPSLWGNVYFPLHITNEHTRRSCTNPPRRRRRHVLALIPAAEIGRRGEN